MKTIHWALAGVGALYLWSRYNTAKKAGVPMVEAIKRPLAGVEALMQEAKQAWDDSGMADRVRGQLPPKTPQQEAGYPMGSYKQETNPDAQLTPAWIDDDWDEQTEDLSDYN